MIDVINMVTTRRAHVATDARSVRKTTLAVRLKCIAVITDTVLQLQTLYMHICLLLPEPVE